MAYAKYILIFSFFLGEYVKDIDFLLLPQDPILDLKFPRPVVERGYCYGVFQALEVKNRDDTGKIGNRDCDSGDYLQPLSGLSSRVTQLWSHPVFYCCCFQTMMTDRQKNIFQIAMYYEPDQSIITEVW